MKITLKQELDFLKISVEDMRELLGLKSRSSIYYALKHEKGVTYRRIKGILKLESKSRKQTKYTCPECGGGCCTWFNYNETQGGYVCKLCGVPMQIMEV